MEVEKFLTYIACSAACVIYLIVENGQNTRIKGNLFKSNYYYYSIENTS